MAGYEDYLRALQRPESGGNPQAVNPQTGAAGLFQIMPGTSAGLRRQGHNFDMSTVAGQTAAAQELTRQNEMLLRSRLGRDPTDAERYFAHGFGGPAAAYLLANPDRPLGQSLREFYGGTRHGERFAERIFQQNRNLQPLWDQPVSATVADFGTRLGGGGGVPAPRLTGQQVAQPTIAGAKEGAPRLSSADVIRLAGGVPGEGSTVTMTVSDRDRGLVSDFGPLVSPMPGQQVAQAPVQIPPRPVPVPPMPAELPPTPPPPPPVAPTLQQERLERSPVQMGLDWLIERFGRTPAPGQSVIGALLAPPPAPPAPPPPPPAAPPPAAPPAPPQPTSLDRLEQEIRQQIEQGRQPPPPAPTIQQPNYDRVTAAIDRLIPQAPTARSDRDIALEMLLGGLRGGAGGGRGDTIGDVLGRFGAGAGEAALRGRERERQEQTEYQRALTEAASRQAQLGIGMAGQQQQGAIAQAEVTQRQQGMQQQQQQTQLQLYNALINLNRARELAARTGGLGRPGQEAVLQQFRAAGYQAALAAAQSMPGFALLSPEAQRDIVNGLAQDFVMRQPGGMERWGNIQGQLRGPLYSGTQQATE